jgi:hypothetical protein
MSLVLYGLVVWFLASVVSGLFIGYFCSLNELWRDEADVAGETAIGPTLDAAASYRLCGGTTTPSAELARAWTSARSLP